jgi:hypothetical protein
MSITFDCEGCGKFYTVPDEVAGRTAKCKQCGTMNVIPAPKPKAKAAGEPQASRATDKTKPMPRPRIPPVPPKKAEEEVVGAEVVEDDAPPPPPKPAPPPKPRQAPPPKKTADEEEIVGADVVEDDEPAAPPPKKRPVPPPETESNPFAFDSDEPPKKKRAGSQPEAETTPVRPKSDKSRRKPADDDAEEDADETEEERPRKPKKKAKKQAGNPALLWVLVGGGGTVLLVLIGAAVLFALGVFSGDPSRAARSGPAPKNTGDPRTPGPSADLYPAASLVSAYQRDQAAADRDYKDKEITVQGIATNIGTDFVDLHGAADRKSPAPANVRCYFADANVIKSVRANTPIIVLGVCKGKKADSADVILENCKPGQ